MGTGRMGGMLAAAAVLALLVVPVAIAGSAGDPGDSQRIASASIKKRFKKLRGQVKALQAQIDELSRRPGVPGPAGPTGAPGAAGVPGAQGPPGSIDGVAAGGDLAGTYPNPQIAANVVGSNEIANNSVAGVDVDDATLFNDQSLTSIDLANDSVFTAELGSGSVGASEIGDSIIDRQDPTPTNIPGGEAENGSYNTDQSVASCNAGEELIGGYGTWTNIAGADEEVFIQRVGLGHDNENVIVVGGNDSGLDRSLVAVATCLQP